MGQSVVGWLIVYQDGDYLYPGQDSQTEVPSDHMLITDYDGTTFGAGTLTWQGPVHSWKAQVLVRS